MLEANIEFQNANKKEDHFVKFPYFLIYCQMEMTVKRLANRIQFIN